MSKSSLSFILSDSDHKPDLKSASKPDFPAKQPKLSLSILQQPIHCKVTSRTVRNSGTNDNRPIHPPPILKLSVDGDSRDLNSPANDRDCDNFETKNVLDVLANKSSLPEIAYYSTYFVTVDVVGCGSSPESPASPISPLSPVFPVSPVSPIFAASSASQDSIICGSKVSTGMYIKLPGSKQGKGKKSDYSVCFVFGDISVRQLGKFRLLFKLYQFNSYKISLVDSTVSDVFTVYSQKKFPSSIPSTPLLRFLHKHGARVRQRKSKTVAGNRPSGINSGVISVLPANRAASDGNICYSGLYRQQQQQKLYEKFQQNHQNQHRGHVGRFQSIPNVGMSINTTYGVKLPSLDRYSMRGSFSGSREESRDEDGDEKRYEKRCEESYANTSTGEKVTLPSLARLDLWC